MAVGNLMFLPVAVKGCLGVAVRCRGDIQDYSFPSYWGLLLGPSYVNSFVILLQRTELGLVTHKPNMQRISWRSPARQPGQGEQARGSQFTYFVWLFKKRLYLLHDYRSRNSKHKEGLGVDLFWFFTSLKALRIAQACRVASKSCCAYSIWFSYEVQV